jgi:diguanylate cyclase (GGDEF)-like protein/PAS domain S-box-containing protein
MRLSHKPERLQIRPSPASGRLQWIAALTAVAVFGVLTGLNIGNSRGWIVFSDGGELLAAALATIACVIRARRERVKRSSASEMQRRDSGDASDLGLQRQTRIAWTLLAAGMGAWAAGEVVTCVYEVGLGTQVPEPSVADVGFLLSYGFIVCGLLAFVRTPAGLLSQIRGAVEGLFIACGFVLCSWSLVVGSVFAHSGALTLGGLVNLAYPVLDALALAGVFFVALQRRHDLPAGLGLLALGIVLVAVSDSSWWYLSEVDSNLPSVTPFETGWVAGFLLIAIAALRSGKQRPRGQVIANRRLTLMLPSLPAVAGVLIVLAGWLLRGHVESAEVLLGIMIAVVMLGVALLVIVTYENHALTSHLEQRVDERTAELEQRTAELQRTERYYRALVQNSSDIVMVVDAALSIRYVSESTEQIFGFSSGDLVGRHIDVFGESAVDSLSEALDRVGLNPGHVARVEWRLTDSTGRVRCAESTIANLLADPHVGGFVLNTRDDTDRAALSDQLRDQAFHDPLTGLANRALLADRASQAFARAGRTGAWVAIIAIDLDAFKLVNDGFGHMTGDELLCTVAHRMQSAVRPEDTVARLGGDEFVVLMDSAPDTKDVLALAERIRDAVHGEVVIEGSEHRLSASIGVAVGRSPSTNFEQLLCDADVALYAVKGTGRNAVQLFQSSMHQNARERFKLQTDLRNAIDNGELCLHYQPEFDASGEQLEGFEALVRWQHPEHGLLSPDAFIPLAEETGLVVPLGRWVLGEALRQTVAWTGELANARTLTISVNVSAVQLSTPGIIADVQSALQQSGIDPGRVVIELTESAFIDCATTVLDTLGALKKLGVRLAIDDFGTGYASVSVLQGMPIDILKIDKSFIASIDDGAHGNDLLEALVNIGRVLSLVTVAEGVEQASQLTTTRELGCDLAQGYLLGRPLPADEAQRMIVEGPAASVSPKLQTNSSHVA